MPLMFSETFSNIRIGTRLAVGFILIVIFTITIGVLSLFGIRDFTNNIRNLYEHPYIVSNSLRSIEGLVVKIHREMKDLVLSETESELQASIQRIEHHEDEVLRLFRLVQERYLGNVDDVLRAKDLFLEWDEIRLEVIKLVREGDIKAGAALTKGQGASHEVDLENSIQRLLSFADRRAEALFAESEEEQQSFFYLLFAILLTAVLLSILVGLFTTYTITEPLRKIIFYTSKISQGNIGIEIELHQRDEIGVLAESYRKMQETLKEKANAAKQIANGDFSSKAIVRGEQDQVALAINQIADNFDKLTTAAKIEDWQKSGQTKLSGLLQGEQSIPTFAEKTVSFLTEYIQAQMGAFYTLDENNTVLSLVGSYAYGIRKGMKNSFAPGEGLVGQCALEMRPITVQDIPEGYFAIESGLGKSVPRNIMVCPLIFEEKILGVLEFASLKEFTIETRTFLLLILPSLAIALNTKKSRIKLEELLEESRKQAEVLQDQQEELRQTNEELEEQTKALRKSEEMLQIQQEELQVSNEELEERTQELEHQKKAIQNQNNELEKVSLELAKRAEEIETASKYKSEFLANMSHELRTPLNSIIILSQLLSEQQQRNFTKKQKEYVQTIYKAGNDLLSLINEILDLSKIESGRVEVFPEETELQEISTHLNAIFEPQAQEKNLEFTITLEDDLPSTIRTDRVRLEQILKNLLSNAVKFTDAGSILLKIYPENDFVNFQINDTGTGIPKDKQAVVFEAFQQAESSDSRRYGGTGLGLSISRELAHLLGGHVELLRSTPNGSSFLLQIPKELSITHRSSEAILNTEKDPTPAEPVAAITGDPLDPEDHRLHPNDDRKEITPNDRVVLIIDDDAAFGQVLRDFAAQRGFKTLIAHNGESGIQLARRYLPQAIILDIGLPGIDGWEVMRELKNNSATRHIPVHFISASDNTTEALRMGAVGFLMKPVTTQSLSDVFVKLETTFEKTIKQLLVVEDDSIQTQSIVDLIGNHDVNITTASSAAEAENCIKQQTFDCMILDLGLKDRSGFDLLEQLQKKERLNFPVIIYTGRDLGDEEEQRLQKYADSIIVKGVKSPERLLDETALFLHRIETDLPSDKQKLVKMARQQEDSFEGQKILLADDDMRNVFALSSVLEERGLVVEVARNGRQCLEKLEKVDSIRLVLMDIMMPELDGIEATKQIRKIKSKKDLPIIALTAKAMKGDREQCILAGANDYVTKPIDIDRLLSILRVWLHG